MSDIEIRVITANQITKCTDLFISVFSKEPWNETWDIEGAGERLRCYLESPNSITLGAFEGKTIVGLIQGSHEPYQLIRAFFVKEFCVSSSYQGAGVGTALWNELERRITQLGVTNISLLTLRDTQAETFYINRGCELADSVRLFYKELR